MSSGPRSGKRNKPGKIGRNDPCFCGSGLKYKKCHLLLGGALPKPSQIPYEFIEEQKIASAQRSEFLASKGILITLPNTISFKGKTVLAVGNEIMVEENPHATFHQLLFRNLQHTMGDEWWKTEQAKEESEKHYILKCFEQLQGSDSRADLDVTQIDENTRSMVATGDTQELLSLAFDVWILAHKGYMREDWLKRLRDPDQYQGARYEIAVASIFVRAGCELEFYDNDRIEEDGRPPKRAEFIAVHKETGNRVAVEAKSRHVKGVLHTAGTLKYQKALRGDVSLLYKKALLKETDGLPLVVFIDVNSPAEGGQPVQKSKWFEDIRRSFGDRPEPTPDEPDTQAALFVTNYSGHYQGDQASVGGQDLFIGSLHTKHPLADGPMGEFMKRIMKSVNNYGYVPPTMDNEKLGKPEVPVGLTKERFAIKIRQLTMLPKEHPDYETRKKETDGLIEMLIWDTEQKSGGGWDEAVAAENYKQFAWLWAN